MSESKGALLEAKRLLRAHAEERIAALSAEDRLVADAQIATQITHLPFWASSHTVFAYLAMDSEVDLSAVIRAAAARGKQLALPRCVGPAMTFHAVSAAYHGELERHRFGFLQPRPDIPIHEPEAGAIVLVPGRVFDRRGFRVGHGQGYYDRFLRRIPAGVQSVGVCYGVQMEAQVPTADYDVAVHVVVSETETCFCRLT